MTNLMRIPTHLSQLIGMLAILATLWLADDGPPTQSQPPSPLPTADARFGAVEAYFVPERAAEARVGWDRRIFYWSEIERGGPDDWNWFHAPTGQLDEQIAAGREIVGLVTHTPDWATDGVEGAGAPNGLYLPLDDPRNYWAQFVRYLFTVYHERVQHWVIWNEPDIALETYGAAWQGTTADYYQLVKTAYLIAHQIDPDMQIHLGGLTYWHNPLYLREYLTIASQDPTAQANGYYFDVVSAHIYFKPETSFAILGSIHDTLEEFGLGEKPIWLNETNAPPYDDPLQPWHEPDFHVTQEMQASFLIQEFALALSMGVERIGVYKWADVPAPPPGFEPYGMIRADGSTRPAYDAYRVITTHYAGVTRAERFEHRYAWTVALARQPLSEQTSLPVAADSGIGESNGEVTTRVVWARVGYRTLALLPALSSRALQVDQTGASWTARPFLGHYLLWLEPAPCEARSECMMGGAPVLLVEDAPADFSQPDSLQPRLVISFTRRVTAAMIAGGIAVLVTVSAILFVLRRRRR